MKIYLSGPISGRPNNNQEAFLQGQEALVLQGHEVVNPIQIVSQITKPETEDINNEWVWCMDACLFELCKCEAIAFLPGWKGSSGATVELIYAQKLGIPLYELNQKNELEPMEVYYQITTNKIKR